LHLYADYGRIVVIPATTHSRERFRSAGQFIIVEDSNNATELFHTGSDGSDHSQPTHARVELAIDLAANQRVDICIEILADGAAGPVVEV
jgi:hypothetical protein